MANIRGKVSPKYAARIDSRDIEKKLVSYFIYKLSGNHTPEASLTEREKTNIFNTLRLSLTT